MLPGKRAGGAARKLSSKIVGPIDSSSGVSLERGPSSATTDEGILDTFISLGRDERCSAVTANVDTKVVARGSRNSQGTYDCLECASNNGSEGGLSCPE